MAVWEGRMRGNVHGIVLLLAVACAAAPRTPEVKAAAGGVPYNSTGQPKPKGLMRCHNERETGSNISERVCKYEDKTELGDSTIDDDLIRASRRAGQHVSPGMGN